VSDPFATVDDVATALMRPLTAAETARAASDVLVASALIRSRLPLIDQWIADGQLDPILARQVVVDMVVRVLRNPKGMKQVQQTAGPYSTSGTWDPDQVGGRVYVTADDLALLEPAETPTPAPPAGTILARPGLAPPPYGLRRPWVHGGARRHRWWEDEACR
jgi:hypothetical protein